MMSSEHDTPEGVKDGTGAVITLLGRHASPVGYAIRDFLRTATTAWTNKPHYLLLAGDAVPNVSPDRQLSGADLESVLLSARRKSLLAGREDPSDAV